MAEKASKRSRTQEPHDSRDTSQSDTSKGTSGVCWELESVLGPQHAVLHTARRGGSNAFERDSESTHLDGNGSEDEDEDLPESKEIKQQLNRKAAQMSRKRKKERIVELEQNVIHLARRNYELKVMIDIMRRLIAHRAQQQTQHEQRLIQYLQAKNTQLKLALSELRNHDGLHELSSAMAIRNASLLGPDFNFQSLGFVPATTLPMHGFNGVDVLHGPESMGAVQSFSVSNAQHSVGPVAETLC